MKIILILILSSLISISCSSSGEAPSTGTENTSTDSKNSSTSGGDTRTSSGGSSSDSESSSTSDGGSSSGGGGSSTSGGDSSSVGGSTNPAASTAENKLNQADIKLYFDKDINYDTKITPVEFEVETVKRQADDESYFETIKIVTKDPPEQIFFYQVIICKDKVCTAKSFPADSLVEVKAPDTSVTKAETTEATEATEATDTAATLDPLPLGKNEIIFSESGTIDIYMFACDTAKTCSPTATNKSINLTQDPNKGLGALYSVLAAHYSTLTTYYSALYDLNEEKIITASKESIEEDPQTKNSSEEIANDLTNREVFVAAALDVIKEKSNNLELCPDPEIEKSESFSTGEIVGIAIGSALGLYILYKIVDRLSKGTLSTAVKEKITGPIGAHIKTKYKNTSTRFRLLRQKFESFDMGELDGAYSKWSSDKSNKLPKFALKNVEGDNLTRLQTAAAAGKPVALDIKGKSVNFQVSDFGKQGFVLEMDKINTPDAPQINLPNTAKIAMLNRLKSAGLAQKESLNSQIEIESIGYCNTHKAMKKIKVKLVK